MTINEAEKQIMKARELKDILEHLNYIDNEFEKYNKNLRYEARREVYFDFIYESGDRFVEDRINDILLHLHTKYENKLKDMQ